MVKTVIAGAVRERRPGERRVALVPEMISRLGAAGIHVLVEEGAGVAAGFADEEYRSAGAEVVPAGTLVERADILLCVGPPDSVATSALRPGQILIGMLGSLSHPELVRQWAGAGVIALSLDLLPRTLSRAQPMDALTSQANVAGYKAALVAADTYGRFFPMLTTAAGTVKPAAVLVLGAGVAGLQAIGTARRLGAVVTAYDVRPQARADVLSLGARFLDLAAVESGAADGGYARELSDAERDAQQRQLEAELAKFDVIITTAQVPGGRPPVLVTAHALAGLRPGSVVVDLAAGDLGGNVEGSVPDRSVVLGNRVTVVGAGNLPSAMAAAASTAYARNLAALLAVLIRDGRPVIDPDDEIQSAILVTPESSVLAGAAGIAVTGGVR